MTSTFAHGNVLYTRITINNELSLSTAISRDSWKEPPCPEPGVSSCGKAAVGQGAILPSCPAGVVFQKYLDGHCVTQDLDGPPWV